MDGQIANANTREAETLFNVAFPLSPADRAAYLERACGSDLILRTKVVALLRSHDDLGGFLPESPKTTSFGDTEVLGTENPGDWIDRYRLVQRIGEGGFGTVYLAEQSEPIKRRVALKIIKLGMDTRQVVARFEAERQALALMDHPNIAKVFDAGATQAGRPYFVMELVPGVPITEYCDQNQLSLNERLDLFLQVCNGVQHAHQKGIIHRDLKPSNILITPDNRKPAPKIIDFGIAKATQEDLTEKTAVTQFHQFMGTPAYVSPEQAQMGGDIDTRTDIYSLGVLLYELLTGRPPFDNQELLTDGLDEMRRIIREVEPKRPSIVAGTARAASISVASEISRPQSIKNQKSKIDADLDSIVLKCLEKDRSCRYETANDLGAEIQRYLKNEAVLARPPRLSYRVGKFVRRNRLAFGAGVVVTVALVIGTAVSSWQAILASRARNAEEQERITAQRERTAAQAAQKIAERERAMAQRHLYAANLNLIQQAWDKNNVGRVSQLLEETSSYPERGFEWFYWQRQVHLEAKTLRGHVGPVHCALFSPNGRQYLTAGADGTAIVWDAVTGKELVSLKGHQGPIVSAAYSPDSSKIVTASEDQTARLWHALNGRQLRIFKGHTAALTAIAFSTDGERIASASTDRTVRLWSVSGEELASLNGHQEAVRSVAFSPDNRRIATGSKDQSVKIWSASDGKELITLGAPSNAISSVAFSPDGQSILAGSTNQAVRIWNVSEGTEVLSLRGQSAPVNAVAFSPEGRRFVTADADGILKVWDVRSGINLLALKGHSAAILSAAFSADGRQIITGSADGTAKVWNAGLNNEPVYLRGHQGGLFAATFSPDDTMVATGSEDATAKLWDVSNGKELRTLSGHRGWVFEVVFSPDGRRILTSSDDQTAKIWDVSNGKELLTVKGHEGGILGAAFSPDGRRIATGSSDKTARLWDASNGKELQVFQGHRSWVSSLAFSPDGATIATGSADLTAKVWSLAMGKELFTLRGHSAWIGSIAFTTDGQGLITGGDQTARVWNAKTGEELLVLKGHNDFVNSVEFSRDGKRIITGSYDRTIKIWDSVTGQELLTLTGHSGQIHSAVFSTDGSKIVSASTDHTAAIWEAAGSQQVEKWLHEKRAAERVLTQRRREQDSSKEQEATLRAQGGGAIGDWLVLLPIPFKGTTRGVAGLQDERLPDEALLRPHAGDSIKIAGVELNWRAVQTHEGTLDFVRLLGNPGNYSVAYAVGYINSLVPRTDLTLKVASDDQSKIYLNRKLIYQFAADRNSLGEDGVAGVELRAGVNVIVFKVVNETGGWQGSVRFLDHDGNPVPGLSTALSPPPDLQ